MRKTEEIKIKATLDCIKDSETILQGEYYVIHSDFVIALEEEIKKINKPSIIIDIKDDENTKEYLKQLQQELDKYKNIIDELEIYLKHTSSGIITENAGIVGVNPTANVLQKLQELKGE